MTPKWALAAAVGLLALGGCSSGHGASPAKHVKLVAWDGAVPAQLRPDQVAPARPCRASQLRIVGTGFLFAPAISGGTGSVTLRNSGPDSCRLTGRPDVQIVGASPAPRQQHVSLPAQPPAFPNVAPPDTALLALPVNATATLEVDWRNWCVPRPTGAAAKKAPVPPSAVRVSLPGGLGRIDADYNAVPSCDAPGQPTTLGIRPFQPAPLRSAPWTTGNVQATIGPLSGSKTPAGKPGDSVAFAVQLRNAGDAPVAFDTCPLVVEMLAPAGKPEVHQLNCGAAGPLQPGGSLRFEMRIKIPADAPAGNNGLFWELDPAGAQGPEVVSRIVVKR